MGGRVGLGRRGRRRRGGHGWIEGQKSRVSDRIQIESGRGRLRSIGSALLG
jgi:hypothetical protein